MSRSVSSAFARLALVALLIVPAATGMAASAAKHHKAPTASPESVTLARLETRYAMLLARHRPDLAERYGSAPVSELFVPLDESTAGKHVRELTDIEAQAAPLAAAADTLRARVRREIAETSPGGALWHDALLWLDIVDAAARAPFALGAPHGCERTHRGVLQLRAIPEALRAAAVMMRGAAAPEPAAFEARIARLEKLLRVDLPARTDACKESGRLAEFVVADTLAAASLAQFRRSLSTGE